MLLNCFSKTIPARERIIAIGDLRLSGEHVVRFELPSEQAGVKISVQELLQQAIRMGPDRILLEEVRGPEALDLIQAMNSGHAGCLAGIYSNSPRESLSRLEMMMRSADSGADTPLLRREIAAAINLIIQTQRHSDGTRRVTHMTECTGFERDQLLFQDIALFEKTGLTESGKITGRFRMTGIQPLFLGRFRDYGITLPRAFFDPGIMSFVN